MLELCHIGGMAEPTLDKCFPVHSAICHCLIGPTPSPSPMPESALFTNLDGIPNPSFMCHLLAGTLCTGALRPGDRFPGTSLLSRPLRPGIAASSGPASGVVSHGPAARPAVLLPVPLRHVCLRSAGLKQFPLDWCPSGHSRLIPRWILSRGVRPFPVHRCPAGSSRLVSRRPLSIDVRLVISTCCRPVPFGWFPHRCTRRGVAVYPDPAGRAYSNARAGV